MNIKEISEKLENLGYATQFHKIINSLSVGIPENDNFKLDSIFRIEQNEKLIKLNYFNKQIPVEIQFESVEELFKEIFSRFPISE